MSSIWFMQLMQVLHLGNVFNVHMFPNLVKLVIGIYCIDNWNFMLVLLMNMPNLEHITFSDVSLPVPKTFFLLRRRKRVIWWKNLLLFIWFFKVKWYLDNHFQQNWSSSGLCFCLVRGSHVASVVPFTTCQWRHHIVFFSGWRKL